MRIKIDAFVLYFIQLGERKDLESAAVRENRAVPRHEPMQSAGRPDELVARPHIQMIGVGENNLRSRLFEIARHDAFDRRLRAHGHIDGRLDVPVRRMQNPGAGADFPSCFTVSNQNGAFLFSIFDSSYRPHSEQEHRVAERKKAIAVFHRQDCRVPASFPAPKMRKSA